MGCLIFKSLDVPRKKQIDKTLYVLYYRINGYFGSIESLLSISTPSNLFLKEIRMKRWKLVLVLTIVASALIVLTTVGTAFSTEAEIIAKCESLYGAVFGVPNTEPFGPCQWDMALINAGTESYAHATGAGVTVGVIDSGVDFTHPDIAPNLNVDLSCSFIFDDTPTADPAEIANGDCSNKGAVQDLNGHGSHVASTIAAPVNGIGIAGVAPEATIVGLKTCTEVGYCFADSVAAALRYAGDVGIDVVNLSLYADPYLYYCKSDADQRAILQDLESAARYAQQNGVLIVTSAGNEQADLQHPGIDTSSPDWPPGSSEIRDIKNNCVVVPAELPGVLTVSATGPIGYPGYDLWIADYSSVGMSRVDVTAPGGDYFQATGTAQDAVLAALSNTSDPVEGIWDFFDFIEQNVPAYDGLTVLANTGDRYGYLNGTSMSSPHAAGVAALIIENHPNWSPAAVKAAVQRTAQQLNCPADWQPLGSNDGRYVCYGMNGRTSFFGHGLVDALTAAQE
jgi:subtilisin family serine protease